MCRSTSFLGCSSGHSLSILYIVGFSTYPSAQLTLSDNYAFHSPWTASQSECFTCNALFSLCIGSWETKIFNCLINHAIKQFKGKSPPPKKWLHVQIGLSFLHISLVSSGSRILSRILEILISIVTTRLGLRLGNAWL